MKKKMFQLYGYPTALHLPSFDYETFKLKVRHNNIILALINSILLIDTIGTS